METTTLIVILNIPCRGSMKNQCKRLLYRFTLYVYSQYILVMKKFTVYPSHEESLFCPTTSVHLHNVSSKRSIKFVFWSVLNLKLQDNPPKFTIKTEKQNYSPKGCWIPKAWPSQLLLILESIFFALKTTVLKWMALHNLLYLCASLR